MKLQLLLHDVQRAHRAVLLADIIRVEAHDAEAHLLIQAPGAGVALDELQVDVAGTLVLAGPSTSQRIMQSRGDSTTLLRKRSSPSTV